MPHPTPLFLWFTDEIRGVGRTAEACRADARRRCRSEHAAYAAEIAPEAPPEPVEAWLAALEAGTVVELRVHGDAERAREVVCALVREHSPVHWWWPALTQLLELAR